MTAQHRPVNQENQLSTFFNILAEDLQMLATLHIREPDAGFIRLLKDEQFPDGLGLKLTSKLGLQASDVATKAIGMLPEAPDQKAMDELAADYAGIYLNHSIQASPEESVWIDEENLTYQDSMFQVREWYGRYGMSAPNWRIRPDDHLVLQLEFIGLLLSGEVDHQRLQEAARFMDEHLLRWLMDFAERVAARCDTDYFASVAMLTGAYCEELRDLIAEVLNQPRPSREEIDERMKTSPREDPVPVAFVPGDGPAV